jgi:hypothetical protein
VTRPAEILRYLVGDSGCREVHLAGSERVRLARLHRVNTYEMVL